MALVSSAAGAVWKVPVLVTRSARVVPALLYAVEISQSNVIRRSLSTSRVIMADISPRVMDDCGWKEPVPSVPLRMPQRYRERISCW